MLKHIALYITNNEDKSKLIHKIISGELIKELCGLKHVLFSEITLNKFIEKEERYAHFDVKTETASNSLKYSSQGERKKALLPYIISKNPDYIIVDNIFDSLDTQGQLDIVSVLKKICHKVVIIQITSRYKEILSFIDNIHCVKKGKLVKHSQVDEPLEAKSQFIEALPETYRHETMNYVSLVSLNNVNVSYLGRPILSNICWNIKPGEFWQLLGPNGSGKSTILTLISGDNPKGYSQDITLFGIKKGSGETVWDIKKNIGFFSSEMLRGFMRSDSILNMVISGFLDSIGLYKYPTDRQISIAYQWLRVLDMYDIKDKSFRFLSDGHKRLVLLARAMVKQPPLLILDEPTNGLDDNDALIFTQLVNKIATETDTAILYVSHRIEDNIKPNYIYQLEPSQSGSIGKVKKGL